MAFPKTWLQIWIQNPVVANVASASLCWFLVDGTINLATFDIGIFKLNMDQWVINAWQPFVPSIYVGQNIIYNFYLKVGVTLVSGDSIPGFYNFFPDVLPNQLCCVIQRITSGFSRSERGRLFIPSVRQIFVNRNNLNSAGMANYQLMATALSQPFASQGINFFPGLVSYSLGTITIISQYVATQRLGIYLRKGKTRTSGSGIVPKPPPP